MLHSALAPVLLDCLSPYLNASHKADEQNCFPLLVCFMGSISLGDDTLAAATIVWNYVGEPMFSMLVLVGAIRMSDRLIRELMELG